MTTLFCQSESIHISLIKMEERSEGKKEKVIKKKKWGRGERETETVEKWKKR